MRSWRWWISLGSIPAWIAVLECVWAAAGFIANARIERLIERGRQEGVIAPEGSPEYVTVSTPPDDPYVLAWMRSPGIPSIEDAARLFAFRWDVPPEKMWTPFFRGWIRANPEALAEIRRGASMPRPEDGPAGRDVEVLRGNWSAECAYYNPQTFLLFAFTAARIARIDGAPDADARLADAFRAVRILTKPDGVPANGKFGEASLHALQVLRHLAETGDPGLAAPGLLDSLRNLQPGMLRRVAIKAARRVNRVRFLLYVNDGRRYAREGLQDAEFRFRTQEELEAARPWHERLRELDEKIGDSGLLAPFARLLLAEDADLWLDDSEKGRFGSEYFDADVWLAGERLALMRAVARLYVLPGESAAPEADASRDLPAELAERLATKRDGGTLVLALKEWTPLLQPGAVPPEQIVRLKR